MSNEPSEQPHNPSSVALSLHGSATAVNSLNTCITGEVSHVFTGVVRDFSAVPVEAKPTAETLRLMARIDALEADVSTLKGLVSGLQEWIMVLEGRS